MAKPLPLRIRRVEERERKGPHGEWRREFSDRLLRLQAEARTNSERVLGEKLAIDGEVVSCRRGCTHCCYHYVAVSLAQAIVIVDFLYREKPVLAQFLDHYQAWQRAASALSGQIDSIRLRGLSSSRATSQILLATRPLSQQYVQTHTPCPFLHDGACAIYEVRPLSCAQHHAVSPPERCDPRSDQAPEIRHSTPRDEDLIRMIRLTGPGLMLYELALPTLVYRLLTEGHAALVEAAEKLGAA